MPDVPSPDANATSMAFADAARTIAHTARRMQIDSPSFRCPPRVVGVDRAVRRRGPDASAAVVSVRIKGRAWAPVLADMIEGVVVANRLSSPQSDRVRSTLWEACGFHTTIDSLGPDGDQHGVPTPRAA